MEFHNRHYLTVDSAGRIIDGWSEGIFPDRTTAGAVLLTDSGGYQFKLCGVENPQLCTLDGIPCYRLDGSVVVPRAEADIEADRMMIPAPPIDILTITQLAVAELAEALLGGNV